MGPWLESYLAERTDMKPGSKAALELTKEKLVDYFTGAKALRSITANEASQWRASIAATRLAPATVKHHVGNAKGMFAEAERRGPVSANPFAHLKSGATAAANERYIAPAEADAIVTALPTAEFKLLFGLARFAGLRCPSETHLLTWADVDFERARLNVRSPKTEHHAGHERRTVPIVPKLMKLLQDAFAAAPEGEARLVRTYGGFTRRTLKKVITAAGVGDWDDRFQALRHSCEIEWASTFPQYAVSKWIGHSISVSGKHYANMVPNELFDEGGAKCGAATCGRHSQHIAR